MSTDLATLIAAGYARSTANDVDVIADDPELIGVLDRRCKQLYSIAARANPNYFGATSAVDMASSKFARPTDAELVIKIEAGVGTGTGADKNLTAGDEIHIVPLEDEDAALAPRVYSFGRFYFTVGGAADPDITTNGDSVVFWYSARHADFDDALAATHATNTLEDAWPEVFNDLFVLHLASYLSLKDLARNETELALLKKETDDLMMLFVTHLKHENQGMKARFKPSTLVNPSVE